MTTEDFISKVNLGVCSFALLLFGIICLLFIVCPRWDTLTLTMQCFIKQILIRKIPMNNSWGGITYTLL